MADDGRLVMAIATLVLMSPGNEVNALKTLIDKPPNDQQMKRLTDAGFTIEQIRHYAQIALDEWERP